MLCRRSFKQLKPSLRWNVGLGVGVGISLLRFNASFCLDENVMSQPRLSVLYGEQSDGVVGFQQGSTAHGLNGFEFEHGAFKIRSLSVPKYQLVMCRLIRFKAGRFHSCEDGREVMARVSGGLLRIDQSKVYIL